MLHTENLDLTGPIGIVLHIDGGWRPSLAVPAYSMAASPEVRRAGLRFEPTNRRVATDLVGSLRPATSIAADAFTA